MAAALSRTPLHDRHAALGARLGPFAGWDMPIEYTTVRDEHRQVRARCGVFDVSHMGQIEVSGAGALAYLAGTLTNAVGRLGPGEGQYTLLCREDGGVIDDLIVYRLADRYLIICNASNVEPVHAWIAGRAPGEAVVTDRSDGTAMLALQGPAWEEALRPICADASVYELPYFGVADAEVAGTRCLVARTGYTGEPGVEIMCPSDSAPAVWDALMAGPGAPAPCGLAARDTLRLEMGYPLYGNDLSLERTPIEAGLRWACDMEGAYPGAAVLRRQAAEGTAERLCMLALDEPGIPRQGCPVVHGGERVGTVTSGTLSPTLGIGIGMAYVRADLAAPGTGLQVDIRGKLKAATTRRRPLVDTSPKKEQ
jgi:aminomethyltransferase